MLHATNTRDPVATVASQKKKITKPQQKSSSLDGRTPETLPPAKSISRANGVDGTLQPTPRPRPASNPATNESENTTLFQLSDVEHFLPLLSCLFNLTWEGRKAHHQLGYLNGSMKENFDFHSCGYNTFSKYLQAAASLNLVISSKEQPDFASLSTLGYQTLLEFSSDSKLRGSDVLKLRNQTLRNVAPSFRPLVYGIFDLMGNDQTFTVLASQLDQYFAPYLGDSFAQYLKNAQTLKIVDFVPVKDEVGDLMDFEVLIRNPEISVC